MRGKRGRPVPILFTEVEKDVIRTMINSREKVCVRKDNVFVFSAPTRMSVKHSRGNNVLIKVFHQTDGLNKVERIRSTDLPKYCGAVSEIADLDETNLRWLANDIESSIACKTQLLNLRRLRDWYALSTRVTQYFLPGKNLVKSL